MAQVTRVTDHGGGVWSIPVPIPDNPLGYTLVHLLDTDRGPVLIDTGWDDPTAWDALTAGLAACGASVADVHGVLVTHHHPDHHGLSGRVREASGAWIAMHAADAQVVRRTREAEPSRWLDYLEEKLGAAGAPEEHLAPLRATRASGRTGLPGQRAALPDREIVPGELLDLPGRRLRAIWTPATPPAMSASTSKRPIRPPERGCPAMAGCSPGTICCLRSAPISGSTRTPTTRPSPIRSATTSTPSNASPPSPPPRCSPPISTLSPTPRRGCGRCWTTTRSGWPGCWRC
ncbi:hypothetical protein SVIO_038090 [Streptomyces violaceusniger]|uniref:Metallo-beta-lactamase domain-containing protein n=1 Tax=Streptomyces violaceusniger TaxID=68280 RepID=A0A4D4L1Y6_STRVO|nr:hypothetical protein SVIO_038090 [Streptomyces violaceusniger]